MFGGQGINWQPPSHLVDRANALRTSIMSRGGQPTPAEMAEMDGLRREMTEAYQREVGGPVGGHGHDHGGGAHGHDHGGGHGHGGMGGGRPMGGGTPNPAAAMRVQQQLQEFQAKMMQRMSPEQQEKMNRIHAKIQQEQMAGTLDQRKMTVYQQELMANFTDEQRREMMEMRQKVMMQMQQAQQATSPLVPEAKTPRITEVEEVSGQHTHSISSSSSSSPRLSASSVAPQTVSKQREETRRSIDLDDLVGSYVSPVKGSLKGTAALIQAVKDGNLDAVTDLLDDGISLNCVDEEGNTPLHWAAYTEQSPTRLEIAKLLIARGAEVDRSNATEHQTPLHWATIHGNAQIVQFLMLNEGDPKRPDKRGYNCLHHAAQYNEGLLAFIFMQRGIDVDCRDNEGHTSLHWASYLGHDVMIRTLLKYGANINAKDNQGYTALHWAANKGNSKAARTLIEAGCDIQLTDNDGCTAGEVASRRGFFKMDGFIKEHSRFYAVAGTRSGKRNQRILWFCIGWFGLYTILFLLSTQPVWLAIVCIAAMVYLIKSKLGWRFPGREHENTFFQGAFIMGYWAVTITYFYEMFPYLYDGNEMSQMIWMLDNVLISLLYIYLLRLDPGVIKRTHDNDLKSIVARMERGERVPKYCSTCMMAKPLRSKHCGACDHCVARFDHHCVWINQDIGQGNHKYFLLLVVLVCLSHWWFLSMCYRYFTLLEGTPDYFWPLHQTFPIFYDQSPLVFVFMIIFASQVFWQTYMLYEQYTLISKNYTQNEVLFTDRYPHFKTSLGTLTNPFDKGTTANVEEFLTDKVDWKRAYFLPQHFSV